MGLQSVTWISIIKRFFKLRKKRQLQIVCTLFSKWQKTKVDEKTSIEAGKDVLGKKLQYATDSEVVVNKIAVSALKSVYHHIKQKPSEESALYAASAVNSVDGKGEAFKEEPQWLPFGYPEHYKPTTLLETPKLGFAVAAPTLNLQEGDRDILIKYATNTSINAITTADLVKVFDVYATGEKGWLGPFGLETTPKTGFATQVSGNKMELYLALVFQQELV